MHSLTVIGYPESIPLLTRGSIQDWLCTNKRLTTLSALGASKSISLCVMYKLKAEIEVTQIFALFRHSFN